MIDFKSLNAKFSELGESLPKHFGDLMNILKKIEYNTRTRNWTTVQLKVTENRNLQLGSYTTITFQNCTNVYVYINNREMAPRDKTKNEVADNVTYAGLFPNAGCEKDTFQIRFDGAIGPDEYLLIEYQPSN